MNEGGRTCDDCGDHMEGALARTVKLTVDSAEVDVQQLCPECFADWIDRYQAEMQPDVGPGGDEIIVD